MCGVYGLPDMTGYYSVSNMGRVRSDRYARILEHDHANTRYPIVSLHIEGKRYGAKVHRLVASVWIGPCPQGYEVDHINGNRRDNRVCNLEYVTHATNIQRAAQKGLMPHGESHVWHKLTAEEVSRMRDRYANGERIVDIWRSHLSEGTHPVVYNTIHTVIRGKGWKRVS